MGRFLDHDDWDQTLMESAKGSMIYSWTEKEETTESMVGQAVKSYLRRTDARYNRQFVTELARVELEDLVEVADRFLPHFMEGDRTQTVVVCNPGAVEGIVEDFSNQFGIELETFESLESSYLAL